MIKDTNTRIQLTVSKKILSEFELLADEIGIGRGDLMRVALSFYLDYQEGIRNASRLSEMLDNIRLVSENKGVRQ
jgi:metal-responsive CopG/Arc/MetJ family transcriptional regulator